MVLLTAAGCITLLPSSQLEQVDYSQVKALFWFATVALVAEAAALNFRLGESQQATSSLAFLPFLSMAILFPTLPVVITIAIVVAISNVFIRQKPIHVILFNVGQASVAIFVGAAAFTAVQSIPGEHSGAYIVGFGLLAASFFTINLAVMAIMVALMKNEPVKDILREMIGPRASNLVYDLLASPIAIVIALLYDAYHVIGVFLIVLPLILIRHSYSTKSQLEAANEDLLGVLVTTIETRDPYTSGHSQRVARLAERIAQDMGLPGKLIKIVERSALLHDIGKIEAEYSPLIAKPHELSAEERTIIQTHAQRGAELLQTLSQVRVDVVSSVRHHHERFDGKGYPDGLSGNAIPIAARVIMVCDAIDAMLSDRPYRQALTLEFVREELVRHSGSQFDPAIVSAVLEGQALDLARSLVSEERPRRGPMRVLAS